MSGRKYNFIRPLLAIGILNGVKTPACIICPNTKAYLSYIREDQNIAAAAFEHMFASSGISIFGESRVGDNNYTASSVGMRF